VIRDLSLKNLSQVTVSERTKKFHGEGVLTTGGAAAQGGGLDQLLGSKVNVPERQPTDSPPAEGGSEEERGC